MLELEEAASVMNEERDQIVAQRESRSRSRTRTRVGIGVGYGWGGWNGWGYPRWGAWGGNPYFGGFYRPRVYRRPFCR